MAIVIEATRRIALVEVSAEPNSKPAVWDDTWTWQDTDIWED